ncbi:MULTISPECIES: outer membrane protein assembly factor BamD [Halomonas]|uniref:Outer membrane protein assembly factor BamD n=1 Tax=Halomonas binhaiensis TaxID=2562282 RepID=A0A5C1NBK5_9GAMM|nr:MULTISPECIES: outer membrane protein assembly factor BamD [Halomonas]QEM80564.1 outer membrane protein assembly factor BamD [Halomonas binhaiensis]
MRVITSPAARLGALVLVGVVLSGCASNDVDEERYDGVAERELYEQGREALESGSYVTAKNRLEAIDTRFPFGDYAEQAQLELIYAYYQMDDWETARAAASRFIRLHPNHAQVDYAYYMRGLSAWQAGRFSLESLKLIDISERDVGATQDAYKDFTDLVTRFPNSQYAPDAQQRIVYLRNLLAQHELHVADFYLRKKAYLAAVQRGRWVIENYPQTDASRDALAVMVEGYLGMEMRDRASEVLRVLIDNDPDNDRLDGRRFDPKYVKATPLSA